MSKNDKIYYPKLYKSATYTKRGASLALNMILDLARKGHRTCVFVFDPETGHIMEMNTRRLIELENTDPSK